MNLLSSRSTVLVAVIASLLATTPARAQSAQSDEGPIVAAVTTFLNGIRTRDTSLMRSTVASGATFVPVSGPTGLAAPSAIEGIIERTGKALPPATTNASKRPRCRSTSRLPQYRRTTR